MAPRLALLAMLPVARAIGPPSAVKSIDSTEALLEQIDGRSAFVMFGSPSCEHCEKLEPTWERLAAHLGRTPDGAAVVFADCSTAAGHELCESLQVKAYPTLRWQTEHEQELQEYAGERTYEELERFAEAKLGPMCSARNVKLCDAAAQSEIMKYTMMDTEKLSAFIDESEQAIKAAHDAFHADADALRKLLEKKEEETGGEGKDYEGFKASIKIDYEKADEKRKEKVQQVKDSGYLFAAGVRQKLHQAAMAGQPKARTVKFAPKADEL